jgi:competence protein ComEA
MDSLLFRMCDPRHARKADASRRPFARRAISARSGAAAAARVAFLPRASQRRHSCPRHWTLTVCGVRREMAALGDLERAVHPAHQEVLMLAPVAVLPLVAALLVTPALAATVSRTETVTASAPVGGKVNINTASVKDLMTLTGVGKKVAEKIVEYRGAHGAFKKAEDVRKVEGLGDALWQRNKDRIVVK